MSLSDTAEYWWDVKAGRDVMSMRLAPLDAIEEMLSDLREHSRITFKAHKIKGHPKDSFIVNDTLRILPHFIWENVKTGESGTYSNGLIPFLAERFGFEAPPRYDFKLTFGKYRGEWFSDIMKRDPQYIDWCLENIKGFVGESKRVRKFIATSLERKR